MVFKNFIHFLINKYLKNYIERLDYEKLNLNLKNGNVLLENLHLKPEALAHFNIPATVAVGYIEQLKLTIPWKNLNRYPTEVHIDGLYLLIVSKNEVIQDLTEHYADKMKRVQQKLDTLRKAALDKGKFDNKEMALVERMRLQIMRNLVFTVRNVHICYETTVPTKLGHPFSFGITLHYLELTTATDNKFSRRMTGNTLLIYKVKEINSLSIYWNSTCKSRLNMPFKDVVNDLKSKIATNTYIPNDEQMNYILRPVNLVMEAIIKQRPKEHQFERSTLVFDIQIEQINFHVDSKQISDVLDFIKFQKYTTIYDRCREYRELLLREYFDATTLTPEQRQRLQFLESKLDVFDLAYIRHKLETEMDLFYPVMEGNYADQQQMGKNQMPMNDIVEPINNSDRRHRPWNSLKKVKNKLNDLSRILDLRPTAETEAYIQAEHEYYFEDVPKIDVEINLNKVNLNLLSTTIETKSTTTEKKDEIIACVNVIDARVNLKRMSISSRVECVIDLHSIRIFGLRHNKQPRPVLLLEMVPSPSSFVHVEFVLFPLDQKADYHLDLTIEPLKMIYHASTINRIVKCFESNNVIVWRPKTEIKRRTFVEMEQEYPHKKVFDMKINLKGGLLLFPQYGVYQPDCPMIRANFGDMVLKSCLNEQEDESNDILFHENFKERQFYMKYQLELSDLRILYSQSNKTRIYLLQRTPLIDIRFYKCIFSDDAHLTKWRIGIKTVIGEIYLSKNILSKVIVHLDSVPLFYSNIVTIMERINFYLSIFSPNTTVTGFLSIYNCCFRFLTQPQRSIRADFHIYVSRIRDQYSTDTKAIITLEEPTMTHHMFSALKKSSRTFYRTDHTKLIYSNSATEQ